MAAQGHADAAALVDALAPYASGRDYLNFAEHPVDVRTSLPGGGLAAAQGHPLGGRPGRPAASANHRIPRLYENGLPLSDPEPPGLGKEISDRQA